MKKYKARLKEDDKGIYAISLVDKPANKMQFINPCKKALCTISDNNEVIGLLLRPGQEILRKDEETGEIWSFHFEEEDIKKAHKSLIENNATTNANLQHDGVKQEDVVYLETWIVEDTEMDKTKLYGINPIKGELYTKARIENREVLEEIKNGNVKGFSIEGAFSMELIEEEIKQPEGTNKLSMNIIEKFEAFLASLKEDKPEEKMAEEVKAETEVKAEAEEPAEVEAADEEKKEEEKMVMSPEEMEAAIGEMAKAIEEIKAMIAPAEPSEEEMKADEALKTELSEIKLSLQEVNKRLDQTPVEESTKREGLNLSTQEPEFKTIQEIIDYNNKKQI